MRNSIRILTAMVGASVATVSLAGVAVAKEYVPGHEGDPAYEHHRDHSGADHYGKLYSKPVGGSSSSSSSDSGAPSERSGDDLGPGDLTRTFLPY
ncbi:MAG TPA: hypothetical protein VH008_01715 [Pseudonocardia sp.]|nr:hypothetical protein [Pseudonocardia sp.]